MSGQAWLPASRYAPFLGPGWQMRFGKRSSGKTTGRLDEYYLSPDGEVLRSRAKVLEWYDARGLPNPEDVQAGQAHEAPAMPEIDRDNSDYRVQLEYIAEWEAKKKEERTRKRSPARGKGGVSSGSKGSPARSPKGRPAKARRSSSSLASDGSDSDTSSSDSSSSSESDSDIETNGVTKAQIPESTVAPVQTPPPKQSKPAIRPTPARSQLAGINLSQQRSVMQLSDLQDLSHQLQNAIECKKDQGIIAALRALNMYSMTVELLRKGTHIARSVGELRNSKNEEVGRLARGLFTYYADLVHSEGRVKAVAAPAAGADSKAVVPVTPAAATAPSSSATAAAAAAAVVPGAGGGGNSAAARSVSTPPPPPIGSPPSPPAAAASQPPAAAAAAAAAPTAAAAAPAAALNGPARVDTSLNRCPVCQLQADSDAALKRHIDECLSEQPSRPSNDDIAKRKRAEADNADTSPGEIAPSSLPATEETAVRKRLKVQDAATVSADLSTELLAEIQQNGAMPALEEQPRPPSPDRLPPAAKAVHELQPQQSRTPSPAATVELPSPSAAAAAAATANAVSVKKEAPAAAAASQDVPPLVRMHSNKVLNKYPEGLTEEQFLSEFQTVAKKPFPGRVEQLAISQPGIFEFIKSEIQGQGRIRARAATVKPLLAKIAPEPSAAASHPAAAAAAAAGAAIPPVAVAAAVPSVAPLVEAVPSSPRLSAAAPLPPIEKAVPASAVSSATTLRSPAPARAALDAQAQAERDRIRDIQYNMIDQFCRAHMPCFHQSVFNPDFPLRVRDLQREVMFLMAKLLMHGPKKQMKLSELREKVDLILGFECQVALKPLAYDRTFIITDDCVAMSGRGESEYADRFGERPAIPFDMPSDQTQAAPAPSSVRLQSAVSTGSSASAAAAARQLEPDDMDIDSDLPHADGTADNQFATSSTPALPLTLTKGEMLEWSASLEPKFYKGLEVLLLGEANFSLSYSLMSNIAVRSLVATSLLAPQEVIDSYQDATNFLSLLSGFPNVELLFGVDATKLYLQSAVRGSVENLWSRKYDRVLFWFPHTGINFSDDRYWSVNSNQILLKQFFSCVHHVVKIFGEVHVTLKSEVPYVYWKVKEQAKVNPRLEYVTSFLFDKMRFPGYVHRHTTRDFSAPTTHARTYIFRVLPIPPAEVNALKSSSQLGRGPSHLSYL